MTKEQSLGVGGRLRGTSLAMAASLVLLSLVAIGTPAQSLPRQTLPESVVTVTPSDERGSWEGFGAGLSWWAHAVGQTPYESTFTDLFFGLDPVEYRGATVPGLGMNIARYNIGGGGLPSDNINGAVDRRPAIVPWHKDIDGFWINWFSTDPDSASWDWTRDAEQRAVLANINNDDLIVEFVTHAPMWWMMDSTSSSGGNLQSWNRRDHARYVATVTERARTQWGVNVRSVAPFNEPTAGWWNYPVQQEGANIPVGAQAEVLGYLREELNARGLDDVVIAASDENTMTQARNTYSALQRRNVTVEGRSVTAASLVGKVNVHGYNGLQPWRDDSERQNLRRTVGDKRVWMTEYGDGEGTGLALAQSIIADINYLRPSAWIYWQPLEPYSAWGLVNAAYADPADETSATRGEPLWMYRKYFVFAQFSRFLRPGYEVIGSTDDRSVVAYDRESGKLALITLNEGPARTVRYDLSQFGDVFGDTATITTTAFDGSQLMQESSAALNGNQLRVSMPADSIHSIEIEPPATEPTPAGIGGTVTFEDGSVAEGVDVDRFTANSDGSRGRWLGSARSDSSGQFRFDDVEPGCYILTFIAPPGETFNGSRWFQPGACVGAAEQLLDVNATLDGAPGDPVTSVGGTVRLADGAPAAGVQIDLFAANGDGSRARWITSVPTNADGTYRFDVPAGCHVITMVAPEDLSFGGSRWFQSGVCVNAGDEVTDLDGTPLGSP